MKKDFVWLTGVAVGAWLVLGTLVWLVLPGDNWLQSSLALAICLAPALATLAVLSKTEHRGPVAAIGAVLIAPLVRLVAVVILGALAYAAVPDVKADPFRFLCWVTAFYVVTLTTETYLLLLLPKKRPAAEPTKVPPPNP